MIMKKIIAFIFVISCGFARTEDGHNDCPPPVLGFKSLNIIQEVYNLLKNYSVTNIMTTEYSCNISFQTSETEKMIIQRAEAGSPQKISKISHNINFEEEYPSLIDLFDKLTTKKSPAISYTLNSNCKKVLCAVKEVFGKDVGPKILYILQEYGLNSSPYSFNHTSNWTIEELNILLQGLEDLPKGMLPLDDNKSFVKHEKGTTYTQYTRDDKCTMANSEMRFFNCLWDKPREYILGTTIHEIGHYIGSELGIDDASRWFALSGWETELYYDKDKKRQSKWSHSEEACFLSLYGQTDPQEDFAETFVAYRYMPDHLKKLCPKKYHLVKDLVFNGIEFTKEQKFCEKRPFLNLQVRELLKAIMYNPLVLKRSCNVSFQTSEIERMIIQRAEAGSPQKVSKTSHNVNFEEEYPSLIDLFDKLTTKKKPAISYTLNSNCKKVLCAVKEVFGEDVGPKILYILQEYGLNSSPYSFNHTSNWRIEELNILLQGLEDLPKGMLPLDDNKSFVRHKVGTTYAQYANASGCIGSNNEMRFFDCLWGHPKNIRLIVPVREMAGYIGRERGLEDSPKWLALSGWETELYYDEDQKRQSKWSHSEEACFPSKISRENPVEDFSETFLAYRYTPDNLKETCPKKYLFLKDSVFNGIEFTRDQKFCEK